MCEYGLSPCNKTWPRHRLCRTVHDASKRCLLAFLLSSAIIAMNPAKTKFDIRFAGFKLQSNSNFAFTLGGLLLS